MDKSQLVVSTYDKIAQIYTENYFDDASDNPFLDKFISLLSKNAKILDVGCGPGQFSKYLLERGLQVEGIDVSEEMITIAQQKVPKGHFKIMDMCALEYAPHSFEGLLVAYSLIHLSDEEVPIALKSFYQVLKPNGVMLVITYPGFSDAIIDEPLLPGERTYVNYFSTQELSTSLNEVGFTIISQKETPLQDPEGISDKVLYTIVRKSE